MQVLRYNGFNITGKSLILNTYEDVNVNYTDILGDRA